MRKYWDEEDGTGSSRAVKYWWTVLYPENMKDDWEKNLELDLQVSYAYCVHDKDHTSDEEEERKKHVHMILAFNNTTTYKNAASVFSRLNKEGKKAFNIVKRVVNIRKAYDYLIHDTDDCRKKGKYQYDKSERIEGNNFDIGSLEQISVDDMEKMLDDLEEFCMNGNFTNYKTFKKAVNEKYKDDPAYKSLARKQHGFFEAICRGEYLDRKEKKEEKNELEKKERNTRVDNAIIKKEKEIFEEQMLSILEDPEAMSRVWFKIKEKNPFDT